MKKPDKSEPLWLLAKKYERERENLFQFQDVLLLHECAEMFTKGSDEWCGFLEKAHETHLECAERRKRGRPKKTRDYDDFTLAFMDATSHFTGETCARNLARKAVEAGLVPEEGSEATRIDRLARKYGHYKRNPRALNLETASHYSSDGMTVEYTVQVPLSKDATAEEREAVIERAKLSLLKWLFVEK